MRPLIWWTLALITSSPSVFAQQAQERMDLDGARIFGNRELPNITYIVPWKNEDLELIDVKPVSNLFDEALAPLDRDEFVREVEYYQLLQDQK